MIKNCLCAVVLTLFLSGCSINQHNKDNAFAEKKEPDTKNSNSNVKNSISEKEKEYGIPDGLLKSIALVESQINPYAVNSKGKSHHFSSKQEAVNFVNTSVANGHRNLSIGCLQLHYASHSKKFSSINDMLTPDTNIDYAAKLLKSLHTKTGNWEMAIKKYHASNPRHNNIYYKKVMKNTTQTKKK